MSVVPLKLGALNAEGFTIVRSGIRWLRENGQMCKANQPIAYCNISLEPTGSSGGGASPFAGEAEQQVVLAPRVGGRLTIDPNIARGGYLSLHAIDTWNAETVVGQIETDETPGDADPTILRHLMLAGRRMTALADVHTGVLPGWHGRSRGWWNDAGEKPLTLLSLGVCDATGVVLGEQGAFFDSFEATLQATQLVFVPDHPVAPCVSILLDQLERTPAQYEAIAEDIRSYFGSLNTSMAATDWMFIGTLLTVLQNTPLKDNYSIFSGSGIQRLGPADAILISASVEPQSILRHRKLGYYLHVMRHHQAAAGAAVRTWLANAFEPVKRPIDAIKQDYERLVDNLAKTTKSHVMILNRMSTSGFEDISSYMGFDAPLSDTLSNIAAKEVNLMLQDVADTRDMTIVDVDAVAAEFGGAQHLPDGIHQSGAMQAAIRQEVLHALSGLRAVDQKVEALT